MNWLVIVVIGYALNAVAMAVDKALLRKEVPHPAAYTFYIAVLGGLAIVLLPFDFQIPSPQLLIFNILAGVFFIGGLYLLFAALKKEDASRVTPFVGGLTPFLVLI